MSILDKVNGKKDREATEAIEVKKTESKKTEVVESSHKSKSPVNAFDFTLDELEFLIRLIGSSNFKGNDLMFIYDLVNKLQNLYLDKKGV